MSPRRWLQAAAAAYDRLRPPPPGVTVLIYHRVGGGTDSAIDLPADTFADQLRLITTTRPVLTLDTAVDQLSVGQAVDGVVLTFDDGTSDFTDVVVPLLQQFDVPAGWW